MNDQTSKWYTIDTQLLRVKGFYFITFAAIGCLFPYISLYMKAIGLSKSEAGIVFGLMPFVAFLVQPTVGIVADKFQLHKVCLIICCIFTGIFYNTIILVPSSHRHFSVVKTEIVCNQFGTYINECTHNNKSNFNRTCPLNFEMYFCDVQNQLSNRLNDINLDYTSLEDDQLNKSSAGDFHYKLKENFECSFECYLKQEQSLSNSICFSDRGDFNNTKTCVSMTGIEKKSESLKFTIADLGASLSMHSKLFFSNNSEKTCFQFNMNLIEFRGKQYEHMDCPLNVTMACDLICSSIDSCTDTTVDDLNTASFWLFFFLLLLGNICYAPILSLFDAISYDLLGSEKRNKWGQQRLWGNVSLAVFAVISAFIMDEMKTASTKMRFSIAFYMYGILFLIMCIILCTVRITNKISCGNIRKGVIQLLRNTEILIFLIVVTYFGFLAGGIEAFLFWFLEAELKNNLKIIPGLCMFSNCLGEIILFYFSGRIIKRFGHLKCLYAAFVAHFIRFLSYSFLTHAWFVLPVELLNGVTFSLMWAAATSYGSIITPSGMSGTIQGLLNGVYFGFGKGIGSLVTGELYTNTGIRWTFRIYGIVSAGLLMVYVVVNRILLNNRMVNKKSELKIEVKEKGIHLLDENSKAVRLNGVSDNLLNSGTKDEMTQYNPEAVP